MSLACRGEASFPSTGAFMGFNLTPDHGEDTSALSATVAGAAPSFPNDGEREPAGFSLVAAQGDEDSEPRVCAGSVD